MIFGRIRELVGHPSEIANEALLYDQLMEFGDPVFARQTIPILVKYSRMMNNLFADIQKILSPSGTPRRVLYQGPPGSPTGTLYEEVGKVAIVADPPATAEPSQQAGGSRPGSSGKTTIFRSSAEEYQIGEDGAKTVTGPQDLRPISHSGSGKVTNPAPGDGSRCNSG